MGPLAVAAVHRPHSSARPGSQSPPSPTGRARDRRAGCHPSILSRAWARRRPEPGQLRLSRPWRFERGIPSVSAPGLRRTNPSRARTSARLIRHRIGGMGVAIATRRRTERATTERPFEVRASRCRTACRRRPTPRCRAWLRLGQNVTVTRSRKPTWPTTMGKGACQRGTNATSLFVSGRGGGGGTGLPAAEIVGRSPGRQRRGARR